MEKPLVQRESGWREMKEEAQEEEEEATLSIITLLLTAIKTGSNSFKKALPSLIIKVQEVAPSVCRHHKHL